MAIEGLSLIPVFIWKAPLSLIAFAIGEGFILWTLVAMIRLRRANAQIPSRVTIPAPAGGIMFGLLGFLFVVGVWFLCFAFLVWFSAALVEQSILIVLLTFLSLGFVARLRLKSAGFASSCSLPRDASVTAPAPKERTFTYESSGSIGLTQMPWGMAILFTALVLLIRKPANGSADLLGLAAVDLLLLTVGVRMFMGMVNERIVLSDFEATWYDWRGKRKLSVERSEIAPQAKRLPVAARAGVSFDTSRGALRFTKELQGYDELLATLTGKNSGVNRDLPPVLI